MVQLEINGSKETLSDGSNETIQRIIHANIKHKAEPFFAIHIKCSNANLILTSGNYPKDNLNGGGGRVPNALEQQMFMEWEKHKHQQLTPGLIISFLNKISITCFSLN